jgi:P27 family predicted phage terminase small subunit
MARPPKPTALKIVSGTNQPCRMRNDEPKPDSDLIEMPEGMSEKAQKYFEDLKTKLLDCKVVTNIDNYALGMLAVAVADMYDIQEKLDRTGIVIKGRHGYPVISPYFRAYNQKQDQVRRLLIEFGMTPSSRTRVGTGQASDGDDFDF